MSRSSRRRHMAPVPSLTGSLRTAVECASDTYGQLLGAYARTDEGTTVDFSDDAISKLVKVLATASDLAEANGSRRLINDLVYARSRAEHIRGIAARKRGGPLFPGEQLEFLRASHEVQQLAYRLDEAARLAQRYEGPRPVRTRVVVEASSELPPRSAPSAADLRLPVGAAQPIEVTLPAALIGLAVLFLPASHRARYHEEFRAEVRDLPSNRQVGYGFRQCVHALVLRRGVIANRLSSRLRGSRDRDSEDR